jgi:hypothetical protein
LIKGSFIRPYRYAEWVLEYALIFRIDVRYLDRATSKDEYPIPIADVLSDNTSRHKVLSFLDGNACYNQILWSERIVPNRHLDVQTCGSF